MRELIQAICRNAERAIVRDAAETPIWVKEYFPLCSAVHYGGCIDPATVMGDDEGAHLHSKLPFDGRVICFAGGEYPFEWDPDKPTAAFLHEYAHRLEADTLHQIIEWGADEATATFREKYRRRLKAGEQRENQRRHNWRWRSEYRRLLREWGWPREMLGQSWLGLCDIRTPELLEAEKRFQDAGRYPGEKGLITPDLSWYAKIKASVYSFHSRRRGD